MGGARSRSKTPRQRDGVRYLVVHPCAGNNNTIENTSEQARMREIQRIHIDDNGWCLCSRYGISESAIVGHYNMSSSACPGQAIKDALPNIRTNVKVRLHGGSPY